MLVNEYSFRAIWSTRLRQVQLGRSLTHFIPYVMLGIALLSARMHYSKRKCHEMNALGIDLLSSRFWASPCIKYDCGNRGEYDCGNAAYVVGVVNDIQDTHIYTSRYMGDPLF